MRQHNYEQKEYTLIAFVLLILLESIGIIFLLKIKQVDYYKLNGFYTNPNRVTVIVTKEEKKLLYENGICYVMDQKRKYKVEEDKGIILKKNHKNYYELLLNVKTPKNKKRQDVIEITIPKEKKTLWDLIKKVGEGDKNKKNKRR